MIQGASQLENEMVMRPVEMQVTAQMKRQVVKQVILQATHVWIQVSAQVRTQVDLGCPFLPFQKPPVREVVWILPAPFGGLIDCVQGTHCPGQVLYCSTLLHGGTSLSWRENRGKQHLGRQQHGVTGGITSPWHQHGICKK